MGVAFGQAAATAVDEAYTGGYRDASSGAEYDPKTVQQRFLKYLEVANSKASSGPER